MAMSTTLEQISSKLKLAESKKHELSEAFQDLHSRSSSFLSLTLQWQELQSHFDAIEASLKTRFQQIESKEQHLASKQHSIEAQIKDLESRETDFAVRLKNFKADETRFQQLESKEQHLASKQHSIEAQIKDLEYRETDFAVRLKNLEAAERRIKSLEKCWMTTPKVKTEPSDDDCNDGELRFSVSMDGKGLQSFLNERVDEHEKIGDEVFAAMKMSLDPAKLVLDAMEGFYPLPLRLKNGGKEFELDVVRRSCVLLLEQLIRACPKIRTNLREVAKGVAIVWKENMGVEELEVLGFLLLVGVYGLVPEFDKDEIAKLFGAVEKHRLASQLRHLLGISDNIAVNIETSLPENSELNRSVASPSESSWPELKSLCINMDGNGLRIFLSEHVKEHDAMQSEVYDALQCASDPVKLVLDAVQGLNSSNPDRVERFKSGVSKRSCILLLGQLIRFSPQIEPVIKEAALKIAVEWKGEFLKQDQKPVKVLGFLQLVATFGLISSFVVDELLCLLKNVYQHISAPDLFRVIGLIPEFVQFFIKKKRLPEAVRYIYAFDLVDKFPPVQLLKGHVDYWMFRAKKLRKEKHLAESEATKKEIDALRAVIKCIADFKLESEYASDILEKHIKRLEKKTEHGKCAEPTPASNAQPHMQSGVKRPRKVISTGDVQKVPVSTSIVHSLRPSISSTIHSIQPNTSSTIQPNQQFGIKHSQTVISTGDTQNVPISTSSIVLSIQPSTSLTIHSIQPTAFSSIHSTQPNQQAVMKHSRTVISTGDAQNDPVSTSSLVLSTQPCTSSTIYSVQPSTYSTINSTQPNQQIGFKRSRTVISTGEVHDSPVSTSSTINLAQQNQQGAGMFMNQGAPYSRTAAGYYNFEGSNPYSLHMNSSTRPYAMPGSTFHGSNSGLSAWQYGSGQAANDNMGQFGFAGSYLFGMDTGIANPDGLHYDRPFGTR